MKFCSECGARLAKPTNAPGTRGHRTCAVCGYTHYENPRIIVSCIVCWDDRILVCRRSQEPGRGQWIVPSGFLECGETLEECAARETREETGVVVDPSRLDLYSIVNMPVLEQVGITFRTTVTADTCPHPGPESLEVAFMSEMDLASKEFAWRRAMGDSLERVFREIHSHSFSIQLATLGSEQGLGFKARRYKVGPAE